MSKGTTQVITAAEHKLQTNLEQCGKRIDLALAGIERANHSLAGYACVAGMVARAAKAMLPHGNAAEDGGFESWVKDRFPDVSHKTIKRYMEFSAAIEEKTDTISVFSQKLLDAGAKGFKKADEEKVIEAVPEALGDLSMTRFLKEHHAAKRKAELEANPKPKESKTAAAKAHAERLAGTCLTTLRLLRDPQNYKLLDDELREELEHERLEAGRDWKAMKKGK